ncbi:type I phosphodiesterase/nucleotide pyrophosphatase [Beutenbergia cavernae DSM 12333]|uniref:Type I phosphodiesterase/nucleotide pyrophosphatase n=1 Tax=Beutenbergia cavernae (strain ATCC BAA-8 / DSM 12333 / CCUG 43141 / JCM 11478 / NBRC 16432 / NCIMB 13614 / HKI 0122) TaxID=471853 RepID=C5C383_BEUC1|nr:ectonucleotide pyrophosphatase/phosphodiesterase [Beutenbergia cavernae]ACQ79782.1 type I phosphodiesterase/nucleotide pyrophosphatase [Beutenbergia cavernae DSM 12333]
MSAPHKLLVVSVDAMVGDDVEFARTLPAFGRLLRDAATAQIEAVFPTLTYPNHTAQLTGAGPASSGIYNNTQFQPHEADPDWFWSAHHVRVPTLLDAARRAGLRTAAVQWPATAHADIDTLVPEIWDREYWGGVQEMYRATGSPDVWETYVAKHVDLVVWEPKRDFNDFACAVAADVLERERPDVMVLHLVAVDAARHATGPFSPQVHDALRRIDGYLGRLLDVLEHTGELERTNVVLVSDHGHLAVEQHTQLNAVFAERGFLRIDGAGRLLDYDVICHSAGLSGQLFLAEDLSPARLADVAALLRDLEADPQYRIAAIHTAAEAASRYGLDGPFAYVVESEPGVLVGRDWTSRPVVRREDADFAGYLGNHGHAPQHGGSRCSSRPGRRSRRGRTRGAVRSSTRRRRSPRCSAWSCRTPKAPRCPSCSSALAWGRPSPRKSPVLCGAVGDGRDLRH